MFSSYRETRKQIQKAASSPFTGPGRFCGLWSLCVPQGASVGGSKQKAITFETLSRTEAGNESLWELWSEKVCLTYACIQGAPSFFNGHWKLHKHPTSLGLEIKDNHRFGAETGNPRTHPNELPCVGPKKNQMPERLLCVHGTSAVVRTIPGLCLYSGDLSEAL